MSPRTTQPVSQEAVATLRNFYTKRGRCPSYSEMAALFRYASKQAAWRLAEKLIQAGILKKDPQGKLIPEMGGVGGRAISPPDFSTGSGFARPVLIAGYVQAGFPSPAEEELVDTLTLDQYLVRRPEASFLLKVTGDSMIEAGIHPGDIAIIERGRTARSGDIVLAEIDREWTLKYYRKEGGKVCLMPANPNYPVLHPKEELVVAGVVVAMIRRYR